MKYNASTLVYSVTGTHLIPSFCLNVLKTQYTIKFTTYTFIQINKILLKAIVSKSHVQKPNNLKADQGGGQKSPHPKSNISPICFCSEVVSLSFC